MNRRQVRNDEMVLVEIILKTPGGKTYIFENPARNNMRVARCNRSTSEGHTCMKYAGWKTDHPGTGACAIHGGRAGTYTTKAVKRYSYMKSYRLRQQMDVLLQDADQLLDLSKELAALKVLTGEMIDSFPESTDDNFTIHLARFTQIVKALANTVDKISLIKSRQALTVAQVMYVRAAMVDVLVKHIADPVARQTAVQDLIFRMGGSTDNFKTGQDMYKIAQESGIAVDIFAQ